MKKSKISLLVVMVFCFSLFGTNTLAVGAPNPHLPIADDSILSQHIKEADGTTGQDTNTGSGIKTGHIQDGAVTTGKIVDNSITTNKISDGSVTTPKITDGAVSTDKITDGAVTDSKITGPISGSKLGNHAHNGADITDGTITTQKIADGTVSTPKIAAGAITPDKVGFYNNVIIVAPSGGDFTSPVDAMNAITNASASNPYLVKIMPGVYNIGSQSVQMKAYVDIEGSGENVTKLTGVSGVIISAASNAELRFLTVENSAGLNGTAISIDNASPTITHVKAVVSGSGMNITISISNGSSPVLRSVAVEASVLGSGNNKGIYVTSNCSPTLTDVIINVLGGGNNYGVDAMYSSSLKMTNVIINALNGSYVVGISLDHYSTLMMSGSTINAIGGAGYNYGVWTVYQSTAKIDNSVIAATTYTVTTQQTNSKSMVGSTRLEGGPADGSTTVCAGVYDENYVFYANTCP